MLILCPGLPLSAAKPSIDLTSLKRSGSPALRKSTGPSQISPGPSALPPISLAADFRTHAAKTAELAVELRSEESERHASAGHAVHFDTRWSLRSLFI